MPKQPSSGSTVKRGSAGKKQVVKERALREGDKDEVLATSPMQLDDILRVAQSSLHIGPLPPAQEFAAYNKGVPDAAERILRMAEKNQNARNNERLLGLGFSFFLGLSFLVAIVKVALYAPNPYAIVSLGSLVSLVSLVVLSGGWIYYKIGRKK